MLPLLRSSTLATITTICLVIFSACLCQLVAAVKTPDNNESISTTAPTDNNTDLDLVCRPFGMCEPCPTVALNEPYCQPFGNRRLLHCINATSTTSPSTPPHTTESTDSSSPLDHPQTEHPKGEELGWAACGRIVSQERADFFEFVACNIFFALVSLCVLVVRSRRLQARQAMQLAARIGVVRAGIGRR